MVVYKEKIKRYLTLKYHTQLTINKWLTYRKTLSFPFRRKIISNLSIIRFQFKRSAKCTKQTQRWKSSLYSWRSRPGNISSADNSKEGKQLPLSLWKVKSWRHKYDMGGIASWWNRWHGTDKGPWTRHWSFCWIVIWTLNWK